MLSKSMTSLKRSFLGLSHNNIIRHNIQQNLTYNYKHSGRQQFLSTSLVKQTPLTDGVIINVKAYYIARGRSLVVNLCTIIIQDNIC